MRYRIPLEDRLLAPGTIILLGCGLRRKELIDLTCDHIQRREDHWAIVDLVGEGGHIRTVSMPDWVKETLDDWLLVAGIKHGKLFRCVCRKGAYPLVQYLNRVLTRWATRKYKKLRHHFRRVEQWITRISRRDLRLFAHWQIGVRRGSAAGAL